MNSLINIFFSFFIFAFSCKSQEDTIVVFCGKSDYLKLQSIYNDNGDFLGYSDKYCSLKDSIPEGKWLVKNSLGKIIEKSIIREGKKVSSIKYSEEGILLSKMDFNDSTSKILQLWDFQGNVKELRITFYDEGKSKQVVVKYENNEVKSFEENLIDGKNKYLYR